jgi:hypothetical protein
MVGNTIKKKTLFVIFLWDWRLYSAIEPEWRIEDVYFSDVVHWGKTRNKIKPPPSKGNPNYTLYYLKIVSGEGPGN